MSKVCPDCGHSDYHCIASGCNESDCDCETWWAPDPPDDLTILRQFAGDMAGDSDECIEAFEEWCEDDPCNSFQTVCQAASRVHALNVSVLTDDEHDLLMQCIGSAQQTAAVRALHDKLRKP